MAWGYMAQVLERTPPRRNGQRLVVIPLGAFCRINS